jgi:perosamine synthetase
MIPVFTPELGAHELGNVVDAVRSGWISSKGKFIKEFEEKFSNYCGCKYGVAVTSGTTAIHLALASLNIKPGDEIIIPNFTMIATALPVVYTGATPVFIDSEKETGNIDVSLIEKKITPKTKAIIPVHIYGHPCDMDEINQIAKRYNLKVIEDAAEAHGAEYKGKKCGSLSDIGCFSFYANKLITTGEGGMLVTNSEEIYKRAQFMKNLCFGESNRFLHEDIGFNYRMTNIQAALGVSQIKKIDSLLKKKIENARIYNFFLKNVEGVITPFEKSFVKNSYWMYGVRFDKRFGLELKEIKKRLFEKGVDTRDFFVGMNEQPVFKQKGLQLNDEFPVSKDWSETGIYLPSGLDLKEEDIRYICECIKGIKKDQ